MKKYVLALFVVLLMAVSACSSAVTPTSEVNTEQPQRTQAPEANTEQPQLTPTPEVDIEQPQPTQTDASLALKYYPLDTMTQIEEIDLSLAAIASGDVQAVRNLFGFTITACKTVNALGGPPACREGEAEGTSVEVLPFLGPEGSYLRKDEVVNFPGLTVTGVYAIYQVSETAYSEENFPKGDYGIMLTAPENIPNIVLQIKNGQIVRIDYVFDPASFETILQRDAANFVLPPKVK